MAQRKRMSPLERELRAAVGGGMATLPPAIGVALLYYGSYYLGALLVLSGFLFWWSLVVAVRERSRRDKLHDDLRGERSDECSDERSPERRDDKPGR